MLETTQTPTTLVTLPTEIVQQIFSLIDPGVVCKYSRLCKHTLAALSHKDFAALNLTNFVRFDLIVSAIRTNPDRLSRLWFQWNPVFQDVYAQRFLKNVDVISWMFKDLSHEIPDSIGHLQKLSVLKLTSNSLDGAVPTSIGNLSNLKTLDLSDNRLSGSIPSSMGSLISLECLMLQGNRLSGDLPESLGNLVALQHFYIANNQLEGKIPSSFSALVNLKQFRAVGNSLEQELFPEILQNPLLSKVLSSGFRKLAGLLRQEMEERENRLIHD
ncbi:UNVERIFIED_CONTAM: hypothetical protein HDU68_004813 [Siphonaria sp. JEL0065]|nr:hypothetical protein HDU68_004813 [Siphonaria sp. JEL0065]